MSLTASTVWEVETGGNDQYGGGFDVSNADGNFLTDGAATNANTTSPLFSSASYTFQSTDANAYVFILSGSNWVPGWYKIAGVSGGVATLNALAGAVSLYGGATLLNTVGGCATTASPSGAVWTIDYSQQATSAAFDSVTSVSTTVTGTAGIFTPAMIGNMIGDGTQSRRITAYTSSTIVTVDSAPGWGSTGIQVGGAFATITQALSVMVISNKIFVKAGSGYTTTVTITLSVSATPAYNQPPNRLIGYTSYRGDGGKATITLSTTTSIPVIYATGNGWIIENLNVDCGSLSGSIGIELTAYYCQVRNCKIVNFSNVAIYIVYPYGSVQDTEVTGGIGSNATIYCTTAYVQVLRCNIHDNTNDGINFGGNGCLVQFCKITNNGGRGILAIHSNTILNNTIYGNADHGILWNQVNNINIVARNNILSSNGGYGMVGAGGSAGWSADPMYDGNAYYNNTSGARGDLDDAGGTNPINGVAPYINSLDVILSADPFTNAGGGDFTLNNTAGGGAACRGAGTPGHLPGISQVGHIDMGALQHQDTGGTTVYFPINTQTIIEDHEELVYY